MSSSEQTTTVVEATRIVRLGYLQTVKAVSDQGTLSRFAGETPSSNNQVSASDPGSPGFLGIGGEGSQTTTSTFTDTGWSISRTWLETWWDKIRWAIGLREIGIHSFEYVTTSEVVSIPYRSPKPIYKVKLTVDERIPNSFPVNNRWISYFISHNNGKEWIAINPIDKPVLFSDSSGQPIPRIITFNSDEVIEETDQTKVINTDQEVKDIRFRAVLARPQGEENSGLSPVLKSYRLSLYPKEGLLA